MNIFGKSAQQKRIDDLATEVAALRKEVARTGVLLTSAYEQIRRHEEQASWLNAERDALQAKLDRMTGWLRQNQKRSPTDASNAVPMGASIS
jgi:uncharacterized coiled-coil protein SlyX